MIYKYKFWNISDDISFSCFYKNKSDLTKWNDYIFNKFILPSVKYGKMGGAGICHHSHQNNSELDIALFRMQLSVIIFCVTDQNSVISMM